MFFKKHTFLPLALLIAIFPIFSVLSQGDYGSLFLDKNQREIEVDYAAFAIEDSRQMRLEVYYQIHNSSLAFKEDGDLFVASYDIKITVMDKRGRRLKVEKREKTITVADKREALSGSSYRTSQINFVLDPGKYDVRFVLNDHHAKKSNIKTKEFKAKLKDVSKGKPKLSKILFAQAVGPLQDNSDLFANGDKVVIPSVTHYYGGGEDKDNKLLYYLEIYPGSEGQAKATVQTLIRKRKGKMVYRDTLTSLLEKPIARQIREISVEGFEPGEYEIEIELKGARGKKFDKTKGKFHIRWDEKSLLQHNYDVLLNQIALIASPKDVKELKKAKSLEEKKAALDTFWKSKDPFPETSRNEFRADFYNRVRLANANYGYLRRQGWETDRGRILVRYGIPDQIEDYPFALDAYPSQIWHYYRKGRYRRFIFVDDSHDGDYRLQYPYDGLGINSGY